jgi:hemerythrin-like domain-containing protein
MGDELISSVMLEEHGKMLKLLNDFIKGKDGAYAELKDMQGKHAFAEEEAIFIFYKDKKNFKLLSDILAQHEQLSEYVKAMEDDKAIAKKFDALMKEHINLEDSKFYPMLDRDLLPDQQEKILEKFEVMIG